MGDPPLNPFEDPVSCLVTVQLIVIEVSSAETLKGA